MQNFTLGKKGYSMLLFALVLLIGSSPSYGQTDDDCPTSAGTTASQEFCFLATVGQIQRDGTNTAVYQTADNANDTQPIPSSELLSDDTTYFVGGENGTCSRVPVTVNVIAEEYPTNTLFPNQNSFTISPCTANFTASDLAGYFETTVTGYEIRVYEEEFGTTQASGQLTPNDSYFVAQVSTSGSSSPNNCPSLRVSVGYDPQPTNPPAADSEQTFCEGATVADLEAQGTYPNTQSIRWYRTENSFQPLASNTVLLDNTTYYATQVVNDRNSPLPPCESADRTAVTVTLLTSQIIAPNTGVVCEDDVQTTFPSEDAIENFLLDLLPAGIDRSGTFNPNAGQLAQMYQNDADGLGDFTTTYTSGEGSCASTAELTISVVPVEDANAGTIEEITVPCGSTDVVILDDSRLSDGATTGGTFSGTGINSDGNFDPTTVSPGTYTITYSVDDSADCVTTGTNDETQFDIIVGDGTTGGSFTGVVCEDDVQTLFPSEDEVRKYLRALLGSNIEGSFNPNVSQLVDMYQADADGLGDFTTEFTPTNGTCNSAVELTISVVPVEDANAGTIEEITVPCGSTDVVILDDSRLSDGATTGGTFSGTGINSDGNFDPTTVSPGTYTITYSVDDSADCVTTGTNDETQFDIIVSDGTTGGSFTGVVCEDDVQTLFTSNDEVRKYLRALLGSTQAGTFNPTVAQLVDMYQADADGLGDFTTEFTPTNGACNSAVELTISVVPVEDANAGTIEEITVPCGSTDVVILDDSRLSDGATTGGTFSGTGINSDGNFDPTTVSPGTYTITYSVDDSADCVTTGTNDETQFDIIVSDGTNSVGTPVNENLCITEVFTLISNPSSAISYFNDLVAEFDPALDGDFTVEPALLGAQILGYVNDPTTPSQTFTTNYTYVSTCGTVSTDISLTINNTTPADAGEIVDFTLCENETNFDLFTKLTSDNPAGGTFSDESGVIVDGLFDISAAGVYTITYTVSEDDLATCLTGSNSTEFDLTVTENTIVIGNENMGIVCESDVQTLFPSVDEIRKYLIALLDPSVNKTAGTFSPTAAQLAQMYQNDADGFGDFITTYTITDGECSSSVELTLRVLESLDAPVAEVNQSFCADDNNTVGDIAVTGQNVTLFEDEELTTPAVLTNSLVDGSTYFAVSISEDENICNSVPTILTVSVITNADAPEADANQNFCSADSPTVGDLVITGDNITVYEDAELTVEANSTDTLVNGDYYATSFCSAEATLITVTINDPADAPTAVASQSFCLIDNPTVGDIVVDGDNIVFYTDADLTEVADATTALGSGMDYYAVSTNDTGSCSSEATVISVTITDPSAPALTMDGDEFCRSDNPTVQDLINNFSGSGVLIYSSSTGGTAISATTALQNGVTYYGASVNATSGCESSERIAVVTKVEFCGIPEGFSPNGDGINDRFVIPDIAENFPNYSIEIFNRWGNVVFKGNASTGDWDGISNQSGTLGNDVLPVGVYFYILKYNDGQTTPVQGKLYLSI